MFVESGTMPIGVFYKGEYRRGFSLRPLKVKDSMAARRSDDYERCEGDDELMGLLSFAARLEIEGIPREAMTLDLMLEMFDEDLEAVIAADGRLKEEIARFRGQGAQADNPGPAQIGGSLEGGQEDGSE